VNVLGHRWIRRAVTIPAVFAAFFLLVTTLPLWVLAAAAVSPRLPGKWRPLRLLWFGTVYLILQVVGLVALGVLWCAAGFGRNHDRPDMRRRHYRLIGFLLRALVRSAQRVFKLRMSHSAPALPDERPQIARGPRPVLVMSRHAGPGDSFLLVHMLMAVYQRHPRIVLKDTLQWDPVIDVLLNRLPTRFISPNPVSGTDVADLIGVLAGDLTPDDALVIFPEGGNFTEGRRLRGIERLEQAGLSDYAERARGMHHLLPPRPGGAFAAINAAPRADVVFVAHTGLEQLSTLRDLWRGLPMDAEVRGQFWTVPAEDVPAAPDARIDWLYEWWERLDAWIAATSSADTADV
jgi:1-acyl-sn-glycerol-3-phosphate acyltransferase